MLSAADAQFNADARASEALKRILSGEALIKREPKLPYNGAEGVPIREEIVEQFGETIITRNSYGARCLNSPNVFFADVDFNEGTSCSLTMRMIGILSAAALLLAWWTGSGMVAIVLLVLAIPAGNLLAWAINRSFINSNGGSEEIALARVRNFIGKNPNWNVRIYRTPIGMRVLATHQTFDPNEPIVAECFKEIAADRRYVVMCERQACFRARVSPKPWRIGISQRLRGGVWPIDDHRMFHRKAWIDQYEFVSTSYASCKFIESIGSGMVHNEIRDVIEVHDRLSQANSTLPIA